ncbi:MAG: hypothetical protein C4306_03475, partial [Thermoleophilia bacterium]
MRGTTKARIDVVDPGVRAHRAPRQPSHAYLFLGRRLALADSGNAETVPTLMAALPCLGVLPDAISLVVLIAQHYDHAGGAAGFPQALLAAHRLAAAKGRHGDRRATNLPQARVPDLELEEGSVLRLGGFSLRVLHTPGHCSGSICLYERSQGILVTGDTVFVEGGVGERQAPRAGCSTLEASRSPAVLRASRGLLAAARRGSLGRGSRASGEK